jgi:cell division transport system permease protein
MEYTLREGFSGFKRAKLSTTISIITISISLILLGTFAIIFTNIHEVTDTLKREVQIEVFLLDEITEVQHNRMRDRIRARAGVDAVTYISKDDAAEIFKQEFGEDIFSVLDFNPLPASFRVSLQPGYVHTDSIAAIAAFIEGLEGTDTVQYRQSLLEMLTDRIQTVIAISIGIGILLAISAIFLVSNTIRLTIYAKRKLIETMKLVGATKGFIRRPFLVEGFVQGVCGGIVAILFIYVILYFIRKNVSAHLFALGEYEIYFYALVLITGSFLGLLGSAVSIRRFLKI